jgi:nucleoid-associated protein YgaU
MARWVRHSAGIGVIAAGFCAASQFRIDPPSDKVTTGKREKQSTELTLTDITLQLAPSPMAQPAWQEPAEVTNQNKDVVGRSSLSGLRPPPELATDYQSLEDSVSAPTRTFNEVPVENGRTKPLTHTIRDGDSLEDIANRYLGVADRWQELLDANADVLTSRDLLPVNTVIKIPKRQPDGYHAPSDAPEQRGNDDLVPVRNR